MRFFGLFTVLFLGIASGALCSPPSPAPPPNVLFIAVDDLNDWTGCLGHPGVKTPNIDRLARRGMLFTNAHCAAPVCNPSRVATLTGLAPWTTGVYENNQPLREKQPGAVTLPQYFRDNGYRAVGGGKVFHDASEMHDVRSWDDYFFWHPAGASGGGRRGPYGELPDPQPLSRPVHQVAEHTKRNFDWAALDLDETAWPDRQVADWAAEFLGRPQEKPFFLGVGLYRPHVPWYVPKEYFDLYELDEVLLPPVKEDDLDDLGDWARRRALDRASQHETVVELDEWRSAVRGYLAAVSFCDAMVGRILDGLESGPSRDNTIVVLWSDHGYHLGEKNHWHKRSLWERCTRVPLIISVPGMETAGQSCDRPVNLLDLFPTLAGLCGLPEKEGLDGYSLEPLLEDPESQRAWPSITTFLEGSHAVRTGQWRYIRYATGDEELYDHNEDPNEWYNLAAQPEFRPVLQQLRRWLPVDLLNIIAYGDSATDPAANIEEDFTALLEGELNAARRPSNVINAGRSGMLTGPSDQLAEDEKRDYSSPLASDRLESVVIEKEPDVVLLQFGMSDAWVQGTDPRSPSRVSPERFEQNLTRMIRTLRKSGIRVIVMTPHRMGERYPLWKRERLALYASVAKGVAAEEGVGLVDVWGAIDRQVEEGLEVDELLLDGLHLNEQGHAFVAGLISDFLEKNPN